jgi:hypothetical protein
LTSAKSIPHLEHLPALSVAGTHFMGHSYIVAAVLLVVGAACCSVEVAGFLQQSSPQLAMLTQNIALNNRHFTCFILYFLKN